MQRDTDGGPSAVPEREEAFSEETTLVAEDSSGWETDAGDRRRGRSLLPEPGEVWGRFVIEGLLGKGGMGRVYRATDPRLARPVALKVLLADDPDQLTRFLREARSQARVEHPHVLKVHDVGSAGGRPFIAMQLVDGGTLLESAGELTLEQKVGIVRDVADGLHAAHRAGLVHRDVKPGNVLIEWGEDGRPWPYIADFGLVRDLTAPDLTRAGKTFGTPPYMAPEQVTADRSLVDRRTDVYALGATLFELLAGKPPVEGQGDLAVLSRVAVGELRELRPLVPDLPVDLESIVLKCLAYEPGARYDSARALADDLDRFLDGEPVLARRQGLRERLGRRLRRHRSLVAVGAAAAVLAAVSLTLVVRAELRTRRVAELAARFGDEARDLESTITVARLLPRHDTSAEIGAVRRQMEELAAEIPALGKLALGPGSHALARAHLALGEPQAARRLLDRAWQAGYRTPEVRTARGLALGELYLESLEAIRSLPDPAAKLHAREQAERELRDPALALLAEAGGGASEDGASRYVAGLLALYGGRLDEAAAVAESLRRQAGAFDPHRLLGDVETARVEALITQGRHADAVVVLERAAAAYAEGLAIARSDERLYLAECRRGARLLDVETARGGAWKEGFEDLLAPCAAAREVQPTLAEAYEEEARLLWRRGEAGARSGEDPRPFFDRAVAAGLRAGELDGDRYLGWLAVGVAEVIRAEWEMGRGIDPGPAVERSEEALQRVLAVAPGRPDAWSELGLGSWVRARHAVASGGDPQPYLEAAVEAFSQAIRVEPAYVNAHHNLALVHELAGDVAAARGRDPRNAYARAAASYERCLAVSPGMVLAWSSLGGSQAKQASWELNRGIDPRQKNAAARAALERAIELNPRYDYALSNLASSYQTEAQWHLANGEDPSAALAAGDAAVERCLATNPQLDLAVANQGINRLLEARWHLAEGRDPRPLVRQALERLQEAIRINRYMEGPVSPFLAETHVVSARWELGRGAAGRSAANAALAAAALDRARQTGGETADEQRLRAVVARWQAEARRQRGEDPTAAITAGLAAVDRCLSLDAALVEPYATRAALVWLAGRREEARAAAREALSRSPLLRRELPPELAGGM